MVTFDIAGLSETVGVVGTGVSPLAVPAPTASRLGITPLETPASLTTVTGDTIRQRADVTIEDSETRIVGVTSQGAPGNGGSSRFSRGFGGLNSLMKLYDGPSSSWRRARSRSPSTRGTLNASSSSAVPPR